MVVGDDVFDAVTSVADGDVACTVSLAVGSGVIDAVMLFNGGAIVGVVTLSEDSIVGTVTFGGSGVAGIVTFPETIVFCNMISFFCVRSYKVTFAMRVAMVISIWQLPKIRQQNLEGRLCVVKRPDLLIACFHF